VLRLRRPGVAAVEAAAVEAAAVEAAAVEAAAVNVLRHLTRPPVLQEI